MNFPTNLKYTKDDGWVRVEGDEAFVGITDYAQSELGDNGAPISFDPHGLVGRYYMELANKISK